MNSRRLAQAIVAQVMRDGIEREIMRLRRDAVLAATREVIEAGAAAAIAHVEAEKCCPDCPRLHRCYPGGHCPPVPD